MTDKKIIILGAGPAGLALGLKLKRTFQDRVEIIIVERNAAVGGLASSFAVEGMFFDYGSHRLHPATPPHILSDLSELLGDDLLTRPRNGRIFLFNRFVQFPFRITNLIRNLPTSFLLAILKDSLHKLIKIKKTTPQTFAEYLQGRLGETICKHFYFPYAKKLWGLQPEEISVVQAQRRVSADSLAKLIKKVLSVFMPDKKKRAKIFFYPRRGFGQISQALAEEFEKRGGSIWLSTTIEKIAAGHPSRITVNKNGQKIALSCERIFSSIPITSLMELISPAPSSQVLTAGRSLHFRAMVLGYLILKTPHFTSYDAHYIPGEDFLISRISEPKIYRNATTPGDLTGLCLEIPCRENDTIWNLPDDELYKLIIKELGMLGLPASQTIKNFIVKRLKNVYPVYDLDYVKNYERVSRYVATLDDIVTFGRQGLFAHDNTHHTIEMAYCAAECLSQDLQWDRHKWQEYQKIFAQHVVED